MRSTATYVAVALLAAARPGIAAPTTYTYTNFDVPGTTYTVGSGINNAGQVAGYNGIFAYQFGAEIYLRDPAGGAYTSFNTTSVYRATLNVALNDAGTVVVSNKSIGAGAFGATSFVRDPVTGVQTALTDPSVADSGVNALGINNAGEIVGDYVNSGGSSSYSFMLDPVTGAYTHFSIPGAQFTQATSINNNGQIAGRFYFLNGPSQGFVRNADGTYITFDAPNATDYLTDILGINDAGQTVGTYIDSSRVTHSFVRNADGTYLLLSDPATTGATYVEGINDLGQIVGYYGTDAYDRSTNTYDEHGFIATPSTTPTAVPEPGSLALLGAALIGLCFAVRNAARPDIP